MSIARQVAPELPALRRFARLIAGSQAGGDAHVVATLEALSIDPKGFPSGLPPRNGLYKVFLKLWNSTVLPAPSDHFGLEPRSAAERNLEAITPFPRQVFLLRVVEGFSVAEIAAIVDQSSEAVVAAVDQAGREIAQQVATDILIIEDEPIIALDIEALVRELGHGVTGIARTHKEAIASARDSTPRAGARRHPSRRWQLGFGCRQRDPDLDRCAGNFHHRVSRAFADRRKARACVSYHQAFQGGHCQGDDQPGAVLRSPGGSQGRGARHPRMMMEGRQFA